MSITRALPIGRDPAETRCGQGVPSSATGDLRILFRAGRDDWYVALEPRAGEVVASCGIVVTGGRGRFQAVDTATAYRRRGICSRLGLSLRLRITPPSDTARVA
jgi:hypothetical protein